MRKLIVGILVFLVLIGLWIAYAASPSVKDPEFPAHAVITYPWASPSPPQNVPPSLKVVTYNIGYGSGKKNNKPVALSRVQVEDNLASMVEALKRINPDVLALQEVDFRSARTYDINEFTYLAKALQMPYGAYVFTWNKNYVAWPYWPPQYQFGRMASGQGVLSRYPILDQEVTVLDKPKQNPFWYNWFYLDHIIQKILLQVGKEPMTVWHVHLEAFDAPTRLKQIEKFSNLVLADKRKYRLAVGDFNSVSFHRDDFSQVEGETLEDAGQAIQEFMKLTGFHNAEWKQSVLTMPSWDPIKKIDHIFYADSFKFQYYGNMENILGSDHLPFWASFSFY